MNTQANTGFEPMAADAPVRETRPLYWSVRRELWENRWVYLAPLSAAALVVVGHAISVAWLPHRLRAMASGDAMKVHETLTSHYEFASGLIMATVMVVGIFYSLEALYGERKDRSILFWKSLPVSDRTTVLAKAFIPIVGLQLFAFAVIAVTLSAMFVASSVAVAASGMSVAELWTQVSLMAMIGNMLYHLVTVHALWHAPIYAWFLLVSAWARRVPLLWATLPLVAIGVVEKFVLNSAHFANFVMYRLSGPENFSFDTNGLDPMMGMGAGKFFGAPGLWLGLAVAGLFLWAAMRVRRWREPM